MHLFRFHMLFLHKLSVYPVVLILLMFQFRFSVYYLLYFCLLLTVIPRDWNNICVITSSFHMERVQELFLFIFNCCSNCCGILRPSIGSNRLNPTFTKFFLNEDK